jgi:lipopolysaccharide export system protein LptA
VKQRFKLIGCISIKGAAVALALALAASQGAAQSSRTPSLFKASPKEREQPIRITSATLEVRDKEKVATFSGEVHVVQGETDVRSNALTIFYDSEMAKASSTPVPVSGARNDQKIRRMEARGAVVITQKDQRAVGDEADFDVLKNTMTMIGDVVVTRGEDVIRGKRLFVNMTTGVYTMESDGGRVEMLVNQKSGQSVVPTAAATSPRSKRSR